MFLVYNAGMSKISVKIKYLSPQAILPVLATSGSACFDVSTPYHVVILGRSMAKVGTGLAFEVPVGYEMVIRPRGGLSSKGITIANSPGTLDSDYRGELFIILHNTTMEPYQFTPGARIAQIAVKKVLEIEFLDLPFTDTERGIGAFGSTGV
ncbi:hypothetical protein LCGC14_0347720 [marine sediment metagenome]|uniref:dUTP diphosphatase n=1 Tax=marine sediment metagenome TaxID=412755 RepID=A0A0F9TBQ0_9ZZZZ